MALSDNKSIFAFYQTTMIKELKEMNLFNICKTSTYLSIISSCLFVSVAKCESNTNKGNQFIQKAMAETSVEKKNPLYEIAIGYFQKGIDKKFSDAYYGLGYVYYTAPAPIRNYQLAFQNLTKAALLGSKYPYLILSRCYLFGMGIEVNYEKSLTYLQEGLKCCPEFETLILTELGQRYEMGLGVVPDYNKAFEYFKQTSKNGSDGKYYPNLDYLLYELNSKKEGRYNDSISNYYYLGTVESVKENPENAITAFRCGALVGHPICQFELALRLFDGIGCEKDIKTALEWLFIAANNDFALAQYKLAYCYEHGIGMPIDKEQAFYWVTQAANNSLSVAQNALGNFYRYGIGVTADNQKALNWYQIAYENGFTQADGSINALKKYIKAEKIINVLTTVQSITNTLSEYNNSTSSESTSQFQPESYSGIFKATTEGSLGTVVLKDKNGLYRPQVKPTCNGCKGSGYTTIGGIVSKCPRCHGQGYIGR